MTGHGKFLDIDKGYSGKLVIVNANDGSAMSTTEISGGGNPDLFTMNAGAWRLYPTDYGGMRHWH